MSRFQSLPFLSAATYSRSWLHADTCAWVEKDCYVDVWFELPHCPWVELAAAFSMTLAGSFAGDRWIFFRPLHGESRELRGANMQKAAVWRNLLEHSQEHFGAGKLISPGADALWSSDVVRADCRHWHTKTTIVLVELNAPKLRLGYFENTGNFELESEDFRSLFLIDAEPDISCLPLYAELVRLECVVKHSDVNLRHLASRHLTGHLARRRPDNPVRRFRHRFAEDRAKMQLGDLVQCHQWAFATIRQLGSAFELASARLRRACPAEAGDVIQAAVAFDQVSQNSKTPILKATRAANSSRPRTHRLSSTRWPLNGASA